MQCLESGNILEQLPVFPADLILTFLALLRLVACVLGLALQAWRDQLERTEVAACTTQPIQLAARAVAVALELGALWKLHVVAMLADELLLDDL